MKLPAKTGSDNPATSQRADVISNPQRRPDAAMAGSLSRKFPGPPKVGKDVAGDATMVPIKFSSKSPGRQTWKGAAEGYTTKSPPDYVASPAADTYQDTEPFMTGKKPSGPGLREGKVTLNGTLKPYVDKDGGKQNVKGTSGGRTGGEAKSVAGQFGVSKA